MRRHLGIDLAITAESRACLTDETGHPILERRFHIHRGDLEALYGAAVEGMEPDDLLVVVMEPTGSSWIAPAAFFKSKGARVHLVKPEQSADLRDYYTKHVKNDRIDAALLARIPLLHPDGMHEVNLPSGEYATLRRTVARRSRLVEEVALHRRRIRALLHWAMPGMSEVLGESLGKAGIILLGRYGNPETLVRLGTKRIAAILIKGSRGHWREDKAEQILAVARASILLWEGLDGCDFEEVAEDLAAEARMLKALQAEVLELDARASGLLNTIDPQGLRLSMPGFGERTATTVAGRLGDASRFTNAGGIRSYIGIIPGTEQSGETESRQKLTKAGDRILRTSMFLAAEAARKEDPQLAQIYYRQMVDKGNHHTKAICAVATSLATRLAAVLREGRPYVIRDLDDIPVDTATAKKIIAERYTIPTNVRNLRRQITHAKMQKGRHLDGVRSKAFKPSPPEEVTPIDNRKLVAEMA